MEAYGVTFGSRMLSSYLRDSAVLPRVVVVCLCLMSFSTDQAPGRMPWKQARVCAALKPGCLPLELLPRSETSSLFPKGPTPVNRREFAASIAVSHGGECFELWVERVLAVQRSEARAFPSRPQFPQLHMEVVGRGAQSALHAPTSCTWKRQELIFQSGWSLLSLSSFCTASLSTQSQRELPLTSPHRTPCQVTCGSLSFKKPAQTFSKRS